MALVNRLLNAMKKIMGLVGISRRKMIALATCWGASPLSREENKLTEKTEQTVWMPVGNSDLDFTLAMEFDKTGMTEEQYDKGSFKNDRGVPLGQGWFPKAASLRTNLKEANADRKNWSGGWDFFGNGYYFLSARVAEVFRAHDMGNGVLYQINFFQEDKKTPVPGKFFALNFGNVKNSLLAERSRELRPFGSTGKRWNPPWVLRDGNIAVSKIALEGPDIWIEEAMWDGFFVSDRLATTLTEAGLKDVMQLKRCRVYNVD